MAAENRVTENSVVLLGAVRMQFTGDDGEKVQGVQVHYAYLRGEHSDRQVGAVAEKAWFGGFDQWPKYQAIAGHFPVFAEMVAARRSTNKGVKIVAADFDILAGDPRQVSGATRAA